MGQTPQGMERRMVKQMLAHWRKLRGDRMFSFFDDVEPLEIPEIWANVFVLELGAYPGDPMFRLAGEAFAAASSPLRNIRISEVPGNTFAEQSVSQLLPGIRQEWHSDLARRRIHQIRRDDNALPRRYSAHERPLRDDQRSAGHDEQTRSDSGRLNPAVDAPPAMRAYEIHASLSG